MATTTTTGAPAPISNVTKPASGGGVAQLYGASHAAPTSSPSLPQITPNAAYQQSYANALATARSGIAAQVQSALAESQREQQAGNAELGTLNPTVQHITANGQAALGGIANSADATETPNVFHSYISGAQQTAPTANTMSQYGQFTTDAQPLIRQGIADQAAQRQAAIQQYQAEMNQQIAMQQAQYAEQERMAQMQMQHDQSLAQWQRQNQMADMQTQHQWDVQNQATQNKFQQGLYSSLYGPGAQTNPNTGLTNDQTTSIQKSDVFKRYIAGMNAGKLDPNMVFNYLRSANPQLLAVLADNNPTLANLFAGKTQPTMPSNSGGSGIDIAHDAGNMSLY